MAIDWSELLDDIVRKIAKNHLYSVEDFVMFTLVCRSWCQISKAVKSLWEPNGRQMPWLLLAEPVQGNNITGAATTATLPSTTRSSDDNNDSSKCCRRNLNPSINKCYSFMLPETIGRRCWGADHGWIVTRDIDLQMHLFNPLTKARLTLPFLKEKREPLPPPVVGYREEEESSSEEEEIREEVHETAALMFPFPPFAHNEWERNFYVKKVRVFKLPEQCGCNHQCHDPNRHLFVVMAIHGENNWLSYSRPGGDSWILIETTTRGRNVLEVAFCNDLVLILSILGCPVLNVVAPGDLRSTSSEPSRPLRAVCFQPSPQPMSKDFPFFRVYMVELFGNLLLVARYKESQYLPRLRRDEIHTYWWYKTVRFKVFKFDFHDKLWKDLERLGDVALFVGENHCMFVQSSDLPNCRSNAIYFSDDEKDKWNVIHAKELGGGHDLGVYSMEDGSISPVYQGDDMYSNFSCPVWYMPKF